MSTLRIFKQATIPLNALKGSQVISSRAFSNSPIRQKVHEITSKTDFEDALKEKVTIVDFYATWCGPCKALEPVLEQISERVPQAKFVRVDVDQQQEIAQEYSISAMPTLKFFAEGKDSDTVVGANLKSIVDLIKEHTEVDLMKK